MSVLADIRQEAAERFAELGWPTTRLEAWKYTSLAALSRTEWRTDESGGRTILSGAEELAAHEAARTGLPILQMEFVNGRLVKTSGEISGVRTIDDPGSLDFSGNALVALNAAHQQDGARIAIADGTVVEGYIHLVFHGSGDGIWSHPRNVIHAGRNAQVTIVETYLGTGGYYTNAVTELIAGEGSVVDHYKIILESNDAYHTGTLHIAQARSASVTQHNVTIGGKLVRNDLTVLLAGEGANVVLDGLFAVTGGQHVDNHTLIDHVTPHGESLELYKGVLDGSSRGVFDGSIIVREGAQKTVSRQTNHNLLLSETAIVDSKPTLVIHNDDVKCNHGSTIGQLNEEAMFYLRSRGIGEQEARGLLVYAFASEIVDRMKLEPVQEQVRRALFRQLPQHLPDRREKTR
jgi:Fe-S cluster assembly protein SufD